MIIDWRLGPEVPGIEIPRRLYCVATEPAPLAGMSRPRATTPWSALATAGFHWVVCLESEAHYDPAPVGRLLCVGMEDLEGRQQPRDPEREHALICRAVAATMEALATGEGVIVHCWGGSGRTGVVLGCLLLHLGHSAEEVIAHLRSVQEARGKGVWSDHAWQVQLLRGW